MNEPQTIETVIYLAEYYDVLAIAGLAVFTYAIYESVKMFRRGYGHFNYHVFAWIMYGIYAFQIGNAVLFDTRILEIWAIYDYITIIYILLTNVVLLKQAYNDKTNT